MEYISLKKYHAKHCNAYFLSNCIDPSKFEVNIYVQCVEQNLSHVRLGLCISLV